MGRYTGILGLVIIMACAWLISAHKRAIKIRILAWGLGLQLFFAVLVLRTDFGKIFQALSRGVNAMIGYVMETGSPARNVPARPWLVPGTRESQRDWMPHLRGAAGAALDGNTQKSDAELTAAGIVAESGVKRKIGSNIPPPLKPSTIRSRKYARQTQSRRPEEERYLQQVRSGIDPGTAQAAAGIVSLVNTGQLRNAVTSVVRTKK